MFNESRDPVNNRFMESIGRISVNARNIENHLSDFVDVLIRKDEKKGMEKTSSFFTLPSPYLKRLGEGVDEFEKNELNEYLNGSMEFNQRDFENSIPRFLLTKVPKPIPVTQRNAPFSIPNISNKYRSSQYSQKPKSTGRPLFSRTKESQKFPPPKIPNSKKVVRSSQFSTKKTNIFSQTPGSSKSDSESPDLRTILPPPKIPEVTLTPPKIHNNHQELITFEPLTPEVKDKSIKKKKTPPVKNNNNNNFQLFSPHQPIVFTLLEENDQKPEKKIQKKRSSPVGLVSFNNFQKKKKKKKKKKIIEEEEEEEEDISINDGLSGIISNLGLASIGKLVLGDYGGKKKKKKPAALPSKVNKNSIREPPPPLIPNMPTNNREDKESHDFLNRKGDSISPVALKKARKNKSSRSNKGSSNSKPKLKKKKKSSYNGKNSMEGNRNSGSGKKLERVFKKVEKEKQKAFLKKQKSEKRKKQMKMRRDKIMKKNNNKSISTTSAPASRKTNPPVSKTKSSKEKNPFIVPKKRKRKKDDENSVPQQPKKKKRKLNNNNNNNSNKVVNVSVKVPVVSSSSSTTSKKVPVKKSSRKREIPQWAVSKENLTEELRRQNGVDPVTVFGEKKTTVNLQECFPKSSGFHTFNHRHSSGNWKMFHK